MICSPIIDDLSNSVLIGGEKKEGREEIKKEKKHNLISIGKEKEKINKKN